MKNCLLLFLIFCIILRVNSICQANCLACSSQGICTQCILGTFLSAYGECLRCPWLSKTCQLSPNKVPISTSCLTIQDKVVLIDKNTKMCTYCSSACVTCEIEATNCTSCYGGYYLSNNKCIKNDTCNSMSHCNSCVNDPSNSTLKICVQCFKGYFLFGRGCLPCNETCSSCFVNQPALWNNRVAAWFNQTLTLLKSIIYSNTTKRLLQDSAFTDTFPLWTSTQWQAYPLHNLTIQQYNKMDPILVSEMIYVFNFLQAISAQLAGNNTQINVIYKSLFLLGYIPNIPQQKNETQWRSIAKYVSQITDIKWNHFELKNSINKNAQKYISCTECLAPTYVDLLSVPQYPYCNKCNQNCTKCVSLQICTICKGGFYLSNNGCLQCSSNCLTCENSSTTCTSCINGRYLSPINNTCSVCIAPCRFCTADSKNTCLQCVYGYSRLVDETAKCYRCNTLTCLHCSPTNSSHCLVCYNGNYRVNNTCYPCPANCFSCLYLQSIKGPYCYTSNDQYALVQGGTVTRCQEGCNICLDYNQKICSACNSLYYHINTTSASCVRCPQFCYVCDRYGECIEPQYGYIYFDKQLTKCRLGCRECNKQDPQKCVRCERGYYIQNQSCFPCGIGCTNCTSQTVCIGCQPRYTLVWQTCMSCPQNCQSCNSTNLNQCLTCRYNYILQNGQCLTNQICTQGCQTCNSTNHTQCLACRVGYGLAQDSRCIKCMDNCQGSCFLPDITICTSCFTGYGLWNNKCQICPNNTVACISNNVFLFCQSGYFFENGACVKICDIPCQTCNANGTCLTCISGYNLTADSKCVFDVTCNPYCDYCPSGYRQNPSTGNCDKCMDNCQVCNDKGCIICVDKYYVNNHTCLSCISPCLTCDDPVTCLSCVDGYVFQPYQVVTAPFYVVYSNYNNRCIKCDSNCLTCDYLINTCTSCPTNKTLLNGKCVGSFPVQYQYKFNIDYNQFMNNYTVQRFRNVFAKQLNITKDKIAVEYIKQGSTIIGGSVLAETSAQATAIQNKLADPKTMYYFDRKNSNGTYVDGDTYHYHEEEGLSKGAIIGIIVGSILGGLAIIGFIVVGCILCRKRNQRIQREAYHAGESKESVGVTSETLQKHPTL